MDLSCAQKRRTGRTRLPVAAVTILAFALALSAGAPPVAAQTGPAATVQGAEAPGAGAPDPGAPDDPVARSAGEVARVYAAIEANYLDPVDPDKLILDGAIRQALATLDPFSSFFDRDQFRQLQDQARGETKGFGSILYLKPGKVMVIETAQGSPSGRAGLGPGDEIVRLNGTRLAGLGIESMVTLLQQARSGPVRLGVIHPGKVVAQDYELNPAEVAMPTVDKSFLLKPGIGYLHLSGFESKTREEVSDALGKLEQSDAGGRTLRGVILDLRNNHGGIVNAALGVSSLFLRPGLTILTVRGRVQAPQTVETSAPPASYHTYQGPLVVLVNGETASAAEVVAAALEEHDRAVIAGEPTYGKGVVQNVLPLSDAMGLALTTAQYFTPSGRSIQRPIPGTALEAMAPSRTGEASGFRTDAGRELAAGGGVTPDVTIPARALDPWVQFLEQRGAFTDFASDYRAAHPGIGREFEPDQQTLSEFQDFLRRNGVAAPEEFWENDQDYLKLRIRAELLDLAYGLALGDQITTEGDPQVQSAAGLFGRLDELLKPGLRASR
ncbi:MAG TPA: S41 family peptidase [Terriglobia bacterium]|nr:S41 family peptidase [Terriglobia bacterium]